MKKMTTIRYYTEYAKLTLKNIVLSSLLSSARKSGSSGMYRHMPILHRSIMKSTVFYTVDNYNLNFFNLVLINFSNYFLFIKLYLCLTEHLVSLH